MKEFKKKDGKGGFLASLLNMFGRGGSAVGGAGSGFGGSGAGLSGLSGLFATKAGMLGVALGAATIAAGVGVVYNFIGPSSRPAYGPQLFQDTYYAEQASNASLERVQQKEAAQAAPSTLDLFREQARKEGLGLGGGENPEAGGEVQQAAEGTDSSLTEAGNASAAAPTADPAAGAPGAAAKLQAAPSFGSAGGGAGGGASMGGTPKLSGGGMFDGIMNKFAPVYRPAAGQGQSGKSTAMKRPQAAAVRGAPKQALSGGKKGAYGQAKFAGKIGARAAYSADSAGARTEATQAFSGETVGTGDVTSPGGGPGIGGSGISGDGLKSSDPSMSSSQYTPPSVTNAENNSPWEKVTDLAMIAMIAATLLLALGKALMKQAKAKEKEGTPEAQQQAQALKAMAIAAAAGAMAAGGVVIACGAITALKHDQRWTGLAYCLVGAGIIAKAAQIIQQATEKAGKGEEDTLEGTEQPGMDQLMMNGIGGGSPTINQPTNNTDPNEYKPK